MNRIFCMRMVLCAALTAMLLVPVLGIETDSPSKPAEPGGGAKVDRPFASGHHQKAYPEASAPAMVEFVVQQEGGSRVLQECGIHRHDPTSAYHSNGHYFARPILALSAREKALEGYPNWVMEVHHGVLGSDLTYVVCYVNFSTPAFLSKCRDAVLQMDRDYALNNPDKEEGVNASTWPMTHLVAVCRNSISKEVLAVTQSDMLGGLKSGTDITLKFDHVALEKFRTSAAAGQVEFVYYYTYVGNFAYRGVVEVTANNQVRLALQEKLSSEQIEGLAPIFQDQKNKAVQEVSVAVEQVTRVEHPSVLAHLDRASVAERMFTAFQSGRMTFQALRTQNPVAAQMLCGYLQRLLHSLIESSEKPDLKVEIRETENTSATEKGGGLSVPILSLGGSTEDTKRTLERIEKLTGVSFQRVENSEYYEPHWIQVCQLREGWEDFHWNERYAIYVPLETELGYLEAPPVPAQFTLDMAQTYLKLVPLHPAYSGAPVGSVTMWWGNLADIPAGYEICNGELVKSEGAILKGRKPKLIDCFPYAPGLDKTFLAQLGNDGSNNLPAHHHEPALSTGPGGGHIHPVRVTTSHEPGGQDQSAARGDGRHPHDGVHNAKTDAVGDHVHPVSGTIGNSAGVDGDGADTSGANRPAFCEIFFIIRVK